MTVTECLGPETTVDVFLKWGTEALNDAGLKADARKEVRLLLADAEGVTPEHLIAYSETVVRNLEAACSHIRRRAQCEPVSRIIGKRAFWKDDFILGPGVLDPRPDTETLVETILNLRPDRNASFRVLDLGVGSGCLLLSLLGEYPNATGIGTDVSDKALDIADRNKRALNLENRVALRKSHWFDDVEGRFEVVVSNPPYIRTAEIEGLDRDVKLYDPTLALDGGADGMSAYRVIAQEAPNHLENAGVLAVEVGWDQATDVAGLFKKNGFDAVETHRDLAGIERIVSGIWRGAQ